MIWNNFNQVFVFHDFSFQTAILLLRIDDIVSGMKKRGDGGGAPSGGEAQASEGPEA